MEQAATIPLMGTTTALSDFEQVVAEYRPRVFRFLLANLRDHDEAETLTQETFLKAYRARNSYRGDASVSTWLMHIAVNSMRDHLRNRRWQFWKKQRDNIDVSDMSDYLPHGGLTPEETVVAKQQVAAVWEAAQDLPPKQRAVFLMRFVEDMEIAEIAAATGTAEGTVKAHLFQALKRVRQQLVRTR
ncbi:MAG: RNA polymerase sigma factor [Acidobacteriales bacterium]|nr:RNA polymerase sigma factor [Terriglobales bacterium]